MMDKILTIIVPTYNMESLLEKCLTSLIVDSIEYQCKLEVLIVNDGSKDCSSAIAHFYQEIFPHVFRVIDKENGNYGSCVNRGLKEATGKYIKILDADDCFETTNLVPFLEFLVNTDCDVVFSDYVKVDSQGNLLDTINYEFCPKREFNLKEFNSKRLPFIMMHGITYKTSLLRGMRYVQSEGMSYTDQEWIYMPMAYANSLIYFDDVIYKYLLGRDGQTMDATVFEKNFWMEVKGAHVMVDSYIERLSELTLDGREYAKERLLWRSKMIAHSYFFVQQKTDNHSFVVEYDKYLKEKVYDIWKELGERSSWCSFHCIKIWRASGYEKRPLVVKAIRMKDKLLLKCSK